MAVRILIYIYIYVYVYSSYGVGQRLIAMYSTRLPQLYHLYVIRTYILRVNSMTIINNIPVVVTIIIGIIRIIIRIRYYNCINILVSYLLIKYLMYNVCVCCAITRYMQHIHKEDVFGQDMSIKTIVYQASQLFILSAISFILFSSFFRRFSQNDYYKSAFTLARAFLIYFIRTYIGVNLPTFSLSSILVSVVLIIFQLYTLSFLNGALR